MTRSDKTKKFKLNPVVIVALVLCALIAVYCGTTAWLTGGAPVNPIRFLALEDFEYTIEVSADGGTSWTEAENVITFSKSDLENLENYRFRVKQTGNGAAFARVRLSHEWKKGDVRLQGEYNLPFIVNNEELYDNRVNDGYVYYAGVFPVNEETEIFSSFDTANFDSSAITDDVTLSINITVDAVQFNRYQQHWGMDALPWK